MLSLKKQSKFQRFYDKDYKKKSHLVYNLCAVGARMYCTNQAILKDITLNAK